MQVTRYVKKTIRRLKNGPFKAVLRIRIRMDPELLLGSGIIVPDPDLAKSERAEK